MNALATELIKDFLGVCLGIAIYILATIAERMLHQWVDKKYDEIDEQTEP